MRWHRSHGNGKFLGFRALRAGRQPKRRIAPQAGRTVQGAGFENCRIGREVANIELDGKKTMTQYFQGCARAILGSEKHPSTLQGLEEWTRQRLRSTIWKQWKRGTVRFAELRPTGRGQRLGCTNGGKRSRTVEAGEQSGTLDRAAQCLLRLAQNSEIGQLSADGLTRRTAGCGPACIRWCGRGEVGRLHHSRWWERTAKRGTRCEEGRAISPQGSVVRGVRKERTAKHCARV